VTGVQTCALPIFQPLLAGTDLGPYKYLHTIEAPSGRFIHLYRLDYSQIP
jgi:hypothetical protein